MRAYLIINPKAGQHIGHQQLWDAVGYLRDQGWDLVIRETQGPDDVLRFAHQAIKEEVDVVFVAGGDGTVNSAANALVKSDVALGVLPMGTGNVLAAELGLVPVPTPLHRPNVVEAARLLCSGVERWIDLGHVVATAEDGAMVERYFVLWAGIGFDAAVAQVVETQFREAKRRLGPWSFLVAGIDTALRNRGTLATIRWNQCEVRERVILILVSNAQLYAGTVRLSPDALLDDGLLNAYIFKGRGLWDMLRHLVSIVLLRHRRDPRVMTHEIQHMYVETAESLPIHVDAEPLGRTPVSLQVVPRALKILVPAKLPPALSKRS